MRLPMWHSVSVSNLIDNYSPIKHGSDRVYEINQATARNYAKNSVARSRIFFYVTKVLGCVKCLRVWCYYTSHCGFFVNNKTPLPDHKRHYQIWATEQPIIVASINWPSIIEIERRLKFRRGKYRNELLHAKNIRIFVDEPVLVISQWNWSDSLSSQPKMFFSSSYSR